MTLVFVCSIIVVVGVVLMGIDGYEIFGLALATLGLVLFCASIKLFYAGGAG